METTPFDMSKLPVTLRAATPEDIPSIAQIHRHYVLNTVMTFAIDPVSTEDHTSKLKQIQAANLPYLVAVSDDSNVVGYSYLSGFRSGKAGYRNTVELSLFCHPEHLFQGIGTTLLNKILDVAANPEKNLDLVPDVRPDDRKIRHIISCMAVDTDSKENGLGLKKYYEAFGFVLNGHLKQVGHKFDRW